MQVISKVEFTRWLIKINQVETLDQLVNLDTHFTNNYKNGFVTETQYQEFTRHCNLKLKYSF